ncbi:Fras1 related extracellular matrix protein [Nesidiocoris tenuis]|uniref:Fras1 related extracellular matrix protein n=1 Tax=Nesidiocoris tenuis TaxID=355587 RepID=A0ABN7ALI7_9HEMI|nr:Fras1 related extracellular matrix protein [Nesidiocoris tenuis]
MVDNYAAPFFGWDSLRVKLEFKGVVAVSMDLMQLDINQCPDKYYVPNAFKGLTNDEATSRCVPILGRDSNWRLQCECSRIRIPLRGSHHALRWPVAEGVSQSGRGQCHQVSEPTGFIPRPSPTPGPSLPPRFPYPPAWAAPLFPEPLR